MDGDSAGVFVAKRKGFGGALILPSVNTAERGYNNCAWPAEDGFWRFRMPEISRFFGVVIAMYYNDHAPPHFHARYGGQKALISIDKPTILEGGLAPRVLGLVVEWAAMHRMELTENWERSRRDAPLEKIAPLE
jgi:hypothetical protein